MKTIYNIAKAELQNLFYSPIAWLILIIFTFQSSMVLINSLDTLVRSESMGFSPTGVTGSIFSGWAGIFSAVQGYLYLYIPLLTMNLMSREYGSGSIKLLYSSPITNTEIILGKYLSMMIYALVLVAVLCVYIIYGVIVIDNVDFPLILSGLLGFYLLICAYSAIGLFMSSLTSYQIVAAVGTLSILSLLNYVKDWWQSVEFVRDLTYWFAITGRSNKFVMGLICSEDIIYFIVVVALFISMAIICLKSKREKKAKMVTFGRYVAVWAIVFILGYISSRPIFMSYYDATQTKRNTLTQNSQDIIKRLDGGLTITSYVNILDKFFWIGMPEKINDDLKTFEQYIRFKPEIKMKYVYYYDKANNPSFDENFPNLTLEEKVQKMVDINGYDKDMFITPEQIKEKIDLSDEYNRFVRVLERDNGEKTFLRVFDDNMIFPSEAEITAALKRLVMRLPKVGFLKGHEERNTMNIGDRDYSMVTRVKSFRHSLINQGFEFGDVTLTEPISEDVDILVIAEMKSSLSDIERANFNQYIARGGNLIIIGEPGRQEVMNPLIADFGVRFMDGTIVHPTPDYEADLVVAKTTKEAADLSYMFGTLHVNDFVVTMPGAVGLEYDSDRGFDVIPLFVTDSLQCWNELLTSDFIDQRAELNSDLGEVEKSYVTALALKRKMGDKEQKIIVIGDADCLSNGELMRNRNNIRAFNYYLTTGSFFWLSDGEVPVDVRRPDTIDNGIILSSSILGFLKVLFMWVLPGVMFIISVLIWVRRRSR